MNDEPIIETPNEAVETTEPVEQEPELQSPEAYVEEVVTRARRAAAKLAALPTAIKDQALEAMAEALVEQAEQILEANARDVEALEAEEERDDTAALIDRLRLTPERVAEMADGLRQIARLDDPVGEAKGLWRRPNGMRVGRIRVPIGVIGIIYESRPNVTADSAALCLKSGNVCVLRGGSEAVQSNTIIATLLAAAAEKAGVPEGAITFVARTEREVARILLKQDRYIDLLIPRGGESLMATVREESTIPVIKHDKGVCHIYVDANADVNMALDVCENAKVQRPSTCNAMETLLVHQQVARAFLPECVRRLQAAGVEIRGCPKTCSLVSDLRPAEESDYGTEFLAKVLAVKVVKSMDEAMEHIGAFGSGHTEAILTKDYGRAMRFLREVDAGTVMVNASTRLNDGYQFGLGAEIGISTTRIHARGPMGLEALTCEKFIVLGSGQVRE